MSFMALRQISAYCVTLICILGLAAPARAQTLEADSLALVALYDSTGGPGWTNTWDLNTPVSSWYGVGVVGGRVTDLDLRNNNLTGPIPAEIGSLTSLTVLDFYGNQLTGPIPPEIGSLTSLTVLHLGGNQLTGPIPPEIGSLTNVGWLYLNSNQLTGPIPPEIGSLTGLGALYINYNQLTGPIPPEIGSLTALKDLELNNNQLTGPIPPEIGSLTALKDLELNNNQLTGPIPPEIGSLTGLAILYLDSNQLTGPIPAELGSLTNLIYLYLYGNQLTGPIPPEIGNLTSLETLLLNNNNFTDLPNLNTLSALWFLEIDRNRFTFEDIEPNVGVADYFFNYAPQDSVGTEQDTSVAEGASLTLSIAVGGTANQYQWQKDGVDMAGATNDTLIIAPVNPADTGSYILRITNTIATKLTLYSRPAHLTLLTPLQVDSLALVALYDSTGGPGWNNTWDLSSPVSSWHGVTVSGDRVAWLYLSTNNLSGPIPAEIGSLTSLTDLYLYGNQLTGPIPTEIGNLTSLTYLVLYYNQLSGPIPGEIGSLTSLTDLYLYNNQLTGPIPAEIGSLTALKNLELYNNQLTGPIPPEIGRLTSLRLLFLNNNKFTDLPNLNTLSALSSLRIHNNRFTFEDIEPNVGVADYLFTYAPQDSVGTEQDTTVDEGTSLTISIAVGGTANQYQWMKDGVDISGATSDPYTLSNIQFADSGDYNLRITNTIATDLTLYSRPIHVTVPNSPPVAMADSVTTSEDTALTIFVLVNDADPDGDTLTVVSVTQPAHGAAAIDAGDTTLTYTPNANFWGVDSLTYTVSDGKSGLGTATVLVMVISVNDPPEAFALVSPRHDSTLVITNANLGDTLTFAWEGAADMDGDTVRYGAEPTDGLGALLTFGDTTATEVRLPYAAVVTIMEGLEQLTLTGTWDIFAADGEDTTWSSNGPFALTIDASTLEVLRQALLPDQFALHQNYPNPFNPSTTVRFDLPEATEIHLVVYDLMGREVIHLVDGRREAGYHQLVWNGRDARGREVPTGMYIARLLVPTYTRSIKLILLK